MVDCLLVAGISTDGQSTINDPESQQSQGHLRQFGDGILNRISMIPGAHPTFAVKLPKYPKKADFHALKM